jgi:hypothetical protein
MKPYFSEKSYPAWNQKARAIDEGIEILTGVRADKRLEDETFEKDTVNCRVDQRLKQMAERLREFPSVSA